MVSSAAPRIIACATHSRAASSVRANHNRDVVETSAREADVQPRGIHVRPHDRPIRRLTVVLRALGVLAGILDVAIDDRCLATNPARNIRNFARTGPGRRRVYLSHDQVATLAACSAHPTMVRNLAYTGLRCGEATGLRVRSVNRLRKRFVIEENAVMIGYEIHVGTPKTHEKRSVPYPDRLAPMIEHACARKGPEGLFFGDGIHHMRNSGS